MDAWEGTGQPIIAKISDDFEEMMCLDVSGTAKPCEGSPQQGWVYKRLHGGTLQSVTGDKCLTRKGSTITVEQCNDSASQKWQRLCGAWANGDAKSGRVLEFAGKDGEAEAKVRAAQWTGEAKQLWHFKEEVKHTTCSKKKHKVFKFDGTPGSTVTLRSFLSMPSKLITVGMWVKGEKGTPFSYSSKNHVKSFALNNLQDLEVHVKDKKIETNIDFSGDKWTHLAVSWNSESGDLKVYKDGKRVFAKSDVQRGQALTPGGCIWLGQSQQKYCKQHDGSQSYKGVLTDFQVWREELSQEGVEKMMTHPVDGAVLDAVGKDKDVATPRNMRIGYLTRQFSAEEMKEPSPPICKMDAFKKKETPKLPKVGGMMYQFTGSGDVHYRNMARSPCHFDDQSVGEWVLSVVKPKYYKASPLMIQFRTSPSKTNCPWCQNGAVSYIDGCALKFGDEQVSAGFGGFRFPGVAGLDGMPAGRYRPFTSWNGQGEFHGQKRGKNIEATRHGNSLSVSVISEGVRLECRQHSISLQMPNTFKGKVDGIAGSGLGRNHDWTMGPNTKVYKQCKPGEQMPGLKGHCPNRYVYQIREHPFNGNRADKPLYKWFRTWQVDGEVIPSAFYYSGSTGPGSFNRNAGQKVKTIKDVNDRPSGMKKKAMEECKLLRATPAAREKCVFDFMVLGPDAIKDSQKDRMVQRAAKVKTFNIRSVRDITQFVNHAEWAGKPLWECGDEFVAMQKLKAKQHEDIWATRKSSKRQKDAEEMAACPAGFEVVAEQTEAHTQESKKCDGGLMALTQAEVEAAKKAEEKKEEKQEQAKADTDVDDDDEEKQPYWSGGAQPASTVMHNDNCFGIGCVKAPTKPINGPCKDPDFQHKSSSANNICYSKKEYAAGGKNPGCSSWCCTDDKCKASCVINKCRSNVANDPKFLSSVGNTLWASARAVNKIHNPAGANDILASREALDLSTELLQVQESAGEEHVCRDSNKDKALSCFDLKSACGTEMVQAMCAATCGTPWAGNSKCQAKAAAEKKYQCKPASVCKLANNEPVLPVGYQWAIEPQMRVVNNSTKAPCKTWSTYGLAVCSSGKRIETTFTGANNKRKKLSVHCGCAGGGYKLISQSGSSVGAGCTPNSQESQANLTKALVGAYEDYEAQSAAWSQACSELESSNDRFSSSAVKLKPVKAATTKLNVFSAPWRFRKLHGNTIKRVSSDGKCAATFTMGLWVCDTAPSRDVVLYLPQLGYNSFKVGCGCQQLRVQAQYAGKLTMMANQQKSTQSDCSKQYMEWNTQFEQEHYSEYRQRAQQIADETELQCMKSTLELNNLPAQAEREKENTKLILEQNSAHLGALSGYSYKMQMQAKEDTMELEKCKKKHFVLEGLPMYERKTKELAKTTSRSAAKRLRKELVTLKAQLDAHQNKLSSGSD